MDSNPTLLENCIQAISDSTMTLDCFSAETGIMSRTVANELLEFLVEKGIGRRLHGSLISFSSTDRLRASILAIRYGAEIRKVACSLSWKDFERFASEILSSCGFNTTKNVRFTKPRAEIDIVATKLHFALSIDCKHWACTERSRLAIYTEKQIKRTERLLQSSPKLRVIVPMLLAIHPNRKPNDINAVPIVEIDKLRFFVEEIEANLDKVFCLTKD